MEFPTFPTKINPPSEAEYRAMVGRELIALYVRDLFDHRPTLDATLVGSTSFTTDLRWFD